MKRCGILKNTVQTHTQEAETSCILIWMMKFELGAHFIKYLFKVNKIIAFSFLLLYNSSCSISDLSLQAVKVSVYQSARRIYVLWALFSLRAKLLPEPNQSQAASAKTRMDGFNATHACFLYITAGQ